MIHSKLIKHGETRNYRFTKIYNVWRNMIQRTSNKNNSEYNNYGGRGITVCKEWENASLFISWAKNNNYDEDKELDRINNNLGYMPSNCRFVTRSINQINKRKRDDWGIYPKNKNGYEVIVQRNKVKKYAYVNSIEDARNIRNVFCLEFDNSYPNI